MGGRAAIRLTLCDPFTGSPRPKLGGLDWFLGSDAATIAAGKMAAEFGVQVSCQEVKVSDRNMSERKVSEGKESLCGRGRSGIWCRGILLRTH